MAFTIYLRNTTQKVYLMQAALKIASLHIARHIPVERIEAPDGKALDAEAIRRMCQSP